MFQNCFKVLNEKSYQELIFFGGGGEGELTEPRGMILPQPLPFRGLASHLWY